MNKTFYQLTEIQKENAIKFARTELLDVLKMGLVETDKIIIENHVDELAYAAAEGSEYSENGELMMGRTRVVVETPDHSYLV